MVRARRHAYAVRSAQEAVELALKALLLQGGIDPPKWHDVGEALRKEAARFPFLSAAEVEEIASTSRDLRAQRERSMYGDEELELPPGSLFSDKDARSASRAAKRVHDLVRRAFPEGTGTGATGPGDPRA
ncbi:MAG: HEPN domain-containing protein [Planctomycetes bacterium]|nr:HEPN domain-containing protein [Planctomycetota bacterium]